MTDQQKPERKTLMGALDAANRGLQAPQAPSQPQSPAPSARKVAAPSRADTKHFGVYIDPVAHKQLKRLALDRDTSLQDLGIEALNMLFEKYGEPAIAAPNKPKRTV